MLASSSLTLTCTQPGPLTQGGVQKRTFMLCVRHHVGRLLTLSGLHYMHVKLALFICTRPRVLGLAPKVTLGAPRGS